ncbi:hypothetical protein I6N95_05170 [Vagococcus sp. BWB3-3]|uniref:Uncharacterized protein n=1 Tax=Vagococcus allomyrinae TaxID=2794353 RepID=A0A940PBH3_9ENTE|nr:hypothetical protein [Vagococcus allomyrinae]MBP1040401.1 hypothetical protein [Vagococcus allomyrinae]
MKMNILKISTNRFDDMVDTYITRNFIEDGIKHFTIYHVETVDNNILTGERLQSKTVMHEQNVKVNALLLAGAERKGYRSSTPEDIYTFNMCKGIVDDAGLKMYGEGRFRDIPRNKR